MWVPIEVHMSNELKAVSENPDGIQMIKSYLETHGFDGLYTDERIER